MRLKYFICAFLFVFILSVTSLFAQISADNLSKVRVEQLSDAQILEISKRFEASGISEADAIKLLTARGMDPAEVDKYKERLAGLSSGGKTAKAAPANNAAAKPQTVSARDTTRISEPKPIRKPSPIYGYEFFSNPNIKFEPNIRIATPKNYVLGPDDELAILLTGVNESTTNAKVSPEGTVKIPYAGLVYVNGLSIEQATNQIRSKMAKAYPALSSGQTKLTVNLGTVRSIRVTIIGDVATPGTYTVSSLSTLFNALYQSGGPTNRGSLRKIELIRNNRVIQVVDLYNFLQKGIQSDNVSLRDQDVIRIPVYDTRVAIDGAVKRPGIYELKPSETLSDLITYAGGFADLAYRGIAKVTQIGNKERSVKDISSDMFDRYTLKNADSVYFGVILERFANRVVIDGAVYRPGTFELNQGVTLKSLIAKADGLREDAVMGNGYIKRITPDLEKEMISFNLGNIMSGKAEDIALMREDSVFITSTKDLRDETSISIGGYVRAPGTFQYRKGMSLSDVISMANGFQNEAANHRIEISRLVKDVTDTLSNKLVNIITINLDSTSVATTGNFLLEPLDYIYVPRLVNYRSIGNVKIRGEVLFPGDYAQQRRDETGMEFIKRAGGITPLGSLENTQVYRNGVRVDMDLTGKRKRQAKDAVILMPGDSLFIPKNEPFVEVNGSVNNPQLLRYANSNFKYYVDAAGGITENARLKGAYIKYPNGINAPVKSFLFIKNYPKVTAGSQIIVPEKTGKNKLGFAEITTIASALTGIVSLIAILFK
ncbi:SLBB domain-containing protein [Pedobacter agri]|uniref:SLBB domain-containing protein n=1 Tax=Pedobacter agri TaxID=454586 RepID=UPI002786CE62|nr:SLBB domain-containing protein [Pedobacter agri]MDQ1141143.1 protein involved in polysaccharide export with SLBB domain [Pedobacter agri]